jgi:hypothetical protein
MFQITKAVFIIFSTLFFNLNLPLILPHSSSAKGEEHKESPAKTDNIFTPVLMSLIPAPNPVKGSDGKFHLVYELEVTNATNIDWEIRSVEVIDGTNDKRILNSYAGDDVKTKMQLLGDKSSTNTLPPGQSGIIFITFALEYEKEIPGNLSHRLILSAPGGIPPGFAHFLGLSPRTEEYTETGGFTEVGPSDTIVLGPPLEGRGWVAADGCCESHRHIRAFMPINGKIRIAQKFAIDWEMINDDRQIYVGDSKDVSSYFAYGKKALSVADAKVVAAVDRYKNQIPGELPPDITLEEADGNHIVLDLGNGKYALYAHLKPRSITVKEGDLVKRGQVLGTVGNTGNSSAPHLHFHLMSSESTLGSYGLPYVIDEFGLVEKAPSTEAFDKAEIEGVPLQVIPVDKPGTHINELPLDQNVVTFP